MSDIAQHLAVSHKVEFEDLDWETARRIGLTQKEIESVHFQYGDLHQYTAKYTPELLNDGWNTVDGEEIFFISNPGLGLWAYRGRFKD